MASQDEAAMPTSARKTYRRPRRRPAYLRTKTGCLTCRRRKKKCDETQFECLNCSRKGLHCEWPSDTAEDVNKIAHPSILNGRRELHCSPADSDNSISTEQLPLTGSVHDAEDSPASSSSLVLSRASSAIGDRPWLPSTSTDEALVMASGLHGISSVPSAITPKSGPLFDFLRIRFLPQLIRPTADDRVNDFCTRESLGLAFHWPFCMHALLACCGAEIPMDSDECRALARSHYVSAVNGLRVHLASGQLNNQWLVTILTVLMLCIYERSKPQGSSGVDIHLAAAARLIQLYSRCHPVDTKDSPTDRAMHRLVRESFIFHVATSLPFQQVALRNAEIESAFSLAEETLGQHFQSFSPSHPDSPVLGVPPQLFRCIYTIYGLYQNYQGGAIDLALCHRLERDLLWWDHSTAAALIHTPQHSVEGQGIVALTAPGQHDEAEKPDNLSLAGPRLYVLGCRILLRRMLSSNLIGSDPIVHQLVREAMTVVRQLQPASDYFAEYYCWSFLVVGMSLEHPSDRDSLMAQILGFWAATNNGTMRRLADMLRLHWQARIRR